MQICALHHPHPLWMQPWVTLWSTKIGVPGSGNTGREQAQIQAPMCLSVCTCTCAYTPLTDVHVRTLTCRYTPAPHTSMCTYTDTQASCLPRGCPWHLTVLRCPLAPYSPPSVAWAVPGGSAVISFSIFFFSPRRPLQHEQPEGTSSAQSCMRFI